MYSNDMTNKGEKIGKLDRIITVQRVSESADGYGTPVETWTTVKQVWAGVKYPSTKTDENAELLNVASTNVEFTIRYDSTLALTEKDRIVYNSDNHDITGILENGRRDFLTVQTVRNF